MKILRAILLVPWLLFPIPACGGSTVEAVGEPRAPGADAEIHIEEIEGENHMLEVEVTHLLPPDALEPGLTTFLLWIIPENEPAQLGSVMEYDRDDRVARARVTTPAHRFELRVTAERNADVTFPGQYTVVDESIVHE